MSDFCSTTVFINSEAVTDLTNLLACLTKPDISDFLSATKASPLYVSKVSCFDALGITISKLSTLSDVIAFDAV